LLPLQTLRNISASVSAEKVVTLLRNLFEEFDKMCFIIKYTNYIQLAIAIDVMKRNFCRRSEKCSRFWLFLAWNFYLIK